MPICRALTPLSTGNLPGCWADTEFVNREEDMGLPGLRKAKESYHPAFLVKKFRAYLEEEVC